MKSFEITLNGITLFSTDSVSKFRRHLKNNAQKYSSSQDYAFKYINGKNVAEKINTYSLDDFNHDVYMDEVSDDYISNVTQDTIQDIEGLTEVGIDYFFEQDSLENENMVPTYCDGNGGNFVRALCGFHNTQYMGFVK